MAAVLFLFCYCPNWPTKPHIRAKILLNLAHDNEVWQANFRKDKRLMNWQSFMNNVYWYERFKKQVKNNVFIAARAGLA